MTETDKYFHPFILFQHYKNKIDNNKPHALSLSLCGLPHVHPFVGKDLRARSLSLSMSMSSASQKSRASLSTTCTRLLLLIDSGLSPCSLARRLPASVHPSVRLPPELVRIGEETLCELIRLLRYQ